jgi:hypothetical protein
MIGTILSWYGLFTLGCIVGIVVGGWCASLKHADLTNEIARLNGNLGESCGPSHI